MRSPENSTFLQPPRSDLLEGHPGARKVGILRNRALHTRFLLRLRVRRREGARGNFRATEGGFQEGSQAFSKVFRNDWFYSAGLSFSEFQDSIEFRNQSRAARQVFRETF